MTRPILITAIFLIMAIAGFSQTPAVGYEIDAYNGQTIVTCDGSFFDSGGFAENC